MPPVPPDLLFLVPPVSDLRSVSSPPVSVDVIMSEASPGSNKIPCSSSPSGVSLASLVPPAGASVPVQVPVENMSTRTETVLDNKSGSSSDSVPKKGVCSQSSEFNWLSRVKATRNFPKSSIPVTHSAEGVPRVKIPNAVFERGAKAHSDYIVGIFYGNAPSYGKIWGVLNYLWGKDRRVTIHNLSKNAYLFYIPSVSLRQRILQHELWRVGDSPFFVTEWKASFSIDPPSLQRAPIWATLSSVPFDLLTDEGLEIISRPLGKIVDAKPFSSVSSVDVKVIVNLTVRLPEKVEIERENGMVDVLEVSYPWLPPLCPVCNEIGHKANFCPSRKPIHKEQDQVGTKRSSRAQNVSKKGKDTPKARVPNKQTVKDSRNQDHSVPVKSCMNSVLMDLDSVPGAKYGSGKIGLSRSASLPNQGVNIPPLVSSGVEVDLVTDVAEVVLVTDVVEAASVSAVTLSTPQPHTVDNSIATVSNPGASRTESDFSLEEAPFIPAVNTVPSKSAGDGVQENLQVVSLNPFAILDQDDQPLEQNEADSNLPLVVLKPVIEHYPSPQFRSKSTKNKKRKLAKRSPGSGGSPPLLLGDSKPQ